MSDPRHILTSMEDALASLDARIARMASLTEQNLAHAVRGLLERSGELCNRAIADDAEVDALEKLIDSECHETILRFSPVALDLRRVITCMKVCASLERISDHAGSLARRARGLTQSEVLPETGEVQAIYELAAGQLKLSVDSFCRRDLALALRIVDNDDPLDIAHYQFIDRLTDAIATNGARAADYVALIFITRLLERIGDQAVNIAEDTIYHLTARDVRHGGQGPEKPI